MNKIKVFFGKHIACSTGIIFAVLSIILNLVWIKCFHMAHIYDIVHVFPTIFIYEPIINLLGGYVPTEIIFIPLAVIIDFLIGFLTGAVIKRFAKLKSTFITAMIISFAIYWIVITYQWLPII